MCGALPSLLRNRAILTDRLSRSPYNAEIYLERALCHEELGYPDLAVGDAYKALLLTDEVLDESGEYHRAAVEAILKAKHIPGGERDGPKDSDSEIGDKASDGSLNLIHSRGKPVQRLQYG